MPNYINITKVLEQVDKFVEKYKLSEEARQELISLCDYARDEEED